MAKLKRPAKEWIWSPRKAPKPKVPVDVKVELTEKVEALLEDWRPQFVKPPRPRELFNYIVELYSKWFRSYLYL